MKPKNDLEEFAETQQIENVCLECGAELDQENIFTDPDGKVICKDCFERSYCVCKLRRNYFS